VSVRSSLLRQYMAFIGGLVVVLSAAAFLITTLVTRNGLEDLFRSRLERAAVVFEQYTQANRLARENELETLLTSPRFLAAIETADPETIAREVPTHGLLAEADAVSIVDPTGAVLFAAPDAGEEIARRFPASAGEIPSLTRTTDGLVLEVASARIVANNGSTLGWIRLGRRLDGRYDDDLERLTGFDVVLGLDGREIGHSDSPLLVAEGAAAACLAIAPGAVERVHLGGTDVLALRADESDDGLCVVFVGSAERAIAPTMADIRRLLLLMAVAGSALAMAVVWAFTSRRIGRRVGDLVHDAERIAAGDLDFTVRPGAADELGDLAVAFEGMRSQLRRSRNDLEAAHRAQLGGERMAAIGQMATGIIHDFKNPMSVIQGTAELIRQRDPANEKLDRQCRTIGRQVDRMLALTRDLLEFAKGRTELHVEVVRLAAWLEEVGGGHLETYRRQGVRLTLDGPADACVLLDRERMQRVVDNVLTNAREVSKPGDTVRLRWFVDERGDVVVEIQDEGPGVPPDLLDKIFDPFVTSGKENGSGLGLAISRKIVEDHGARIGASNGPGKGARFRIVFPSKMHVNGGEVPVEQGVAQC
jgi:signal transduction histidine kinase